MPSDPSPGPCATLRQTDGAARSGGISGRRMPMIRGIDHIELIVRHLDESVEFFQKLGFKLLTRTSHHGASAELQLPGEDQLIFEIHQVGGEENIGINHIAFKVDNAQAAYDELRA